MTLDKFSWNWRCWFVQQTNYFSLKTSRDFQNLWFRFPSRMARKRWSRLRCHVPCKVDFLLLSLCEERLCHRMPLVPNSKGFFFALNAKFGGLKKRPILPAWEDALLQNSFSKTQWEKRCWCFVRKFVEQPNEFFISFTFQAMINTKLSTACTSCQIIKKDESQQNRDDRGLFS